jgi:hypothetical protein
MGAKIRHQSQRIVLSGASRKEKIELTISTAETSAFFKLKGLIDHLNKYIFPYPFWKY